jgi:hypothetical protein
LKQTLQNSTFSANPEHVLNDTESEPIVYSVNIESQLVLKFGALLSPRLHRPHFPGLPTAILEHEQYHQFFKTDSRGISKKNDNVASVSRLTLIRLVTSRASGYADRVKRQASEDWNHPWLWKISSILLFHSFQTQNSQRLGECF